ncbi:unnamed protein product [Closterium sp. NIES-64]|nr:unnamed protein product [Closterium sp. NIES-64]
MDDPEVLLPSIERRTKQLRQQEQMLREAVTAASRRKETSAAALRSAEDAHQHLLRDRFPALNAQVNAQLDAMAAHAAAIAAFLSPARESPLLSPSRVDHCLFLVLWDCSAVATLSVHPSSPTTGPGSLAMVAGVEPLLEAQEEVALQHEVWKRRQFDEAHEGPVLHHQVWERRQYDAVGGGHSEGKWVVCEPGNEGPSRAVALEGLGLYLPCDLNDLDAAVIAGDHGASIDTPGLAPSHHHPPFPFFSHLAPPTARPTDAIYRCNIRELKHVHDLDDLYLSLSPSYPFLDYTLLPVPLLPVLSTPCSSTYRPRRCHAQQGGGGGAALRESMGGAEVRAAHDLGRAAHDLGRAAHDLGRALGDGESAGGWGERWGMGRALGDGESAGGWGERWGMGRALGDGWTGGGGCLGWVVSKLCKEKARLQDAMVYAGDYELKMQRQRFYLAKMHQLLTQQYWQLAVNVALHGAVLLDAHHLERTWQLLLQLHCDTSAAISDSETRKAAYKALASQATAPTAPTAPTSFSSSQFPPPSSSLPLPASSPLWPALLSALSPPAAQGEPLGAAGGGVAQAAGGREGESGGEVVERLVEGLRGRAQGEGERVQQGVEQSERLLAHMAGMQAAMVELLSSPHATPSSTAAHAMPLHLSPPALVDERLRVERQLSDDVAPAIDRLADEWQTTQRSACGMHVGMGMGMEEDDDSFIF